MKTDDLNPKQFFFLPAILLLTALVFSVVVKNNFINWDDPLYITDNELIRGLSFHGITKIFTTLHFNGYLPFTELSYAIDYLLWKNNPAGYHLTNLLLHLANIVLVFFLARQLTDRKYTPLIAALLFAIHPMRVESVAWAAERKDVLYAFFYLLSLLAYIKYIRNSYKIKFLLLCFLCFVISVLSKWSAFPLPCLLLLLDYYFGRKIGKRAIMEKLVFISIPFLSVFVHLSEGAIITEHFNFIQRIFLGSHSVIFYFIKFLFPFNLSAIYPYPKTDNGFLPMEYYLSLPLLLILIGLLIALLKKYSSERKFILLCTGFFFISIGMVLHVVLPIGGVVVAADRYTYIPFFGLFLMTGYYAETFFVNHPAKKNLKFIFVIFVLCVTAVFSVQTYRRNKLWANSIIFFNDIIKKDSTIAFAWNNLGFAEADAGRQYKAIECYSKAIALKPDFSFAYNNRGLAFHAIGQYEKALADFNFALTIKQNDATLYYNRGLTCYQITNYESAKNDFSRAVEINQENAEAYNYLGLCFNFLNNTDDALTAYNKAIALNPDFSSAYNNRGWIKFVLRDKDGAMKDFSKSIAVDPQFSFPYHNRGLLYFELKMYENACKDWETAANLGYEDSRKLLEQHCEK